MNTEIDQQIKEHYLALLDADKKVTSLQGRLRAAEDVVGKGFLRTLSGHFGGIKQLREELVATGQQRAMAHQALEELLPTREGVYPLDYIDGQIDYRGRLRFHYRFILSINQSQFFTVLFETDVLCAKTAPEAAIEVIKDQQTPIVHLPSEYQILLDTDPILSSLRLWNEYHILYSIWKPSLPQEDKPISIVPPSFSDIPWVANKDVALAFTQTVLANEPTIVYRYSLQFTPKKEETDRPHYSLILS